MQARQLGTQPGTPRSRKHLGLVGLILFGVGLSCFLACLTEGVFRYIELGTLEMPPSKWVSDPDLIYKFNSLNPKTPLSFRGRAPSADTVGKTRILCLGGSTTFGHEMEDNQTWPSVLEHELQSEGIPCEIINAGVEGYGTRQNLIRYKRELSRLNAKFVIIYEGWNRTGALVDPGEFVPEVQMRDVGWIRKIAYWLGSHSSVYQRLVPIARQLLRRNEARTLDSTHTTLGHWSSDPYHQIFIQDLFELVREVKARDQRPILVIYPALYHDGMSQKELSLFEPKLWQREPYQDEMLKELNRKYAAILTVAAKETVAVLDIQGGIAEIRDNDRADLFIDEMHPSVLGNQKVGQLIATGLLHIIRHSDPRH